MLYHQVGTHIGLSSYIERDGVSPMSLAVRRGDRRLDMAVEPRDDGEAPDEAPSEANGEGPSRCIGVVSSRKAPGEGPTLR